jgi:hypothetical protein
MTNTRFETPLGPHAPVGEILLAGTAIRIELPPGMHALAVDRYEAVRNHAEREGSPLRDRIRIFYPQGSMAIRATIRSRKRTDGYDIDIVAELLLPHDTPPRVVLDLLFQAINGPPGSQYHGKVERQTRCITVYYADGMHLDITPTILASTTEPRRSWLFHAKPSEPVSAHFRLVMNSFGFCEWFKARTPIDLEFAKAYGREAKSLEEAKAAADAVPVPAHATEDGGKSAAVVALQLLKRNRNIRYAKRSGRMPPSVMLAKFTGDAAFPGSSISGALVALIETALGALEQADRAGLLLDVRNPVCAEDRFTDRWPENAAAQRTFIADLKLLRSQLAVVMSGEASLEKKREVLTEMFGEGPAQSVVEEYASSLGNSIRSGQRVVGSTGRVMPVAGVAAPALLRSGATQARPHTFFGGRWRRS